MPAAPSNRAPQSQAALKKIGRCTTRARRGDQSLQTDPTGYDDGLNWYAYVGNDPMNQTDSTGMFSCTTTPNGNGVTATCSNDDGPGISRAEYDKLFGGTRAHACGRECQQEKANWAATREQFDEDYGGYFLCAATCAVGAPELVEGGLALSALFKACNCFEAGTLVSVDGGYMPIEKIKVGDLVLSRDDQTGETALKPVAALIPGKKRVIWDVIVETKDGSAAVRREIIHTTEEHPFRTSDDVWTPAAELKPGALILTADRAPAKVVQVSKTDRIVRTYNLEIADFHTYFVGPSGLWVHNACLLPTDKLATAAAKANGWVKTNFKSSGRAVFRDPKTGMFFTADRTNHLGNAMWKGAKSVSDLASKATRSGTYDALLNRIGG